MLNWDTAAAGVVRWPVEQQGTFLRVVLESLSDAVVACDADGELTVFNPAAERLHGLPVEPLPPEQWAERYELRNPDGSAMQVRDIPLYRALRGEVVSGARMLIVTRARGVRNVLVNGAQLRDDAGRVLGAVVSMRDVTDEVVAREHLEVSERRFRLSFDNSPAGMLLVDLRPGHVGRLLQANPKMAEITGYPVAELTTMTGERLAHPADREDSLATLSGLASGEVDSTAVERRFRHADGHTVWVHVRAGVIRDAAGRAPYVVAQVEDITERRLAQARLEQQARLLQLIPAPVIVRDFDGTIRGWNGGAETTYGYPALAVGGLSVHKLLATEQPDDGPDETVEAINESLLRDGFWEGELHHRAADGRRVVVLSRQVVHRAPEDADGVEERPAVLEINTDITALRAAEQAATESEQRLLAQFRYSAAGQVLRALDGRLLEANPAFAAMLATTPDRLAGVDMEDLLHPDDVEGSRAGAAALLAGERDSVRAEGRLRRFDGGWLDYHCTASAVRDPAGRPLYLVVVITDITDPRNAERARDAATAQLEVRNAELAAQEAYLAEILDLLPVSVLTCDERGRLVHLNRAGRATLPAAPAHVRDLVAVAAPGERPGPGTHPLARALRGEVFEAAELVLHLGDGRERALIVDARPMRSPDGQPGAICTAFDVTALRDREAELAAFAGVVAHDLKNPLTGIVGFTEMAADLLAAAPGTERAAGYVRRAEDNARHMDQLIDDLLAFATARDAPLRPEWADLAAMVAHIVTVRTGHLPPAQRPAVTAGNLPAVWADPVMLRQVLDNLVGNAVKYTRPGRRAEVTVTGEQCGGTARITVADRGIGIPEDQRRLVLSSFHRAHTGQGYAGTGLGLAIVQRVVDRHGGTIAIAENPGGGTAVTVSLPQPG